MKSILPLAAASFAGALALSSPQEANAEATICMGNVCQTGSSSVSAGRTSVYSNGRDTYVNGQRVDPRNPNPLTNPSWRPAQPTQQQPQQRYNYNSLSTNKYRAQPVTVTLPETTGSLTCKLGMSMTTSFTVTANNNIKALDYSDMAFESANDLRNMRDVLMQNNYLTPQALPDTCGPKTGIALQKLLLNNPNIVVVSVDGTGSKGVYLDLDLDQKFNPRVDATLAYNF